MKLQCYRLPTHDVPVQTVIFFETMSQIILVEVIHVKNCI